jgi:hypothetical protein
MSGCLCGRPKQIAKIDTTSAYVAKIEKINLVMADEIKTLKAKAKQDSIEKITIEKDRIEYKNQVQILIAQYKSLPLDSTVLFVSANFTDKHPISCEIKGKDTIIGITPTQTKEVGEAFIMRDYNGMNADYFEQELKLADSRDSSQTQIILRYDKILAGKDDILSAKDSQINSLNQYLAIANRKVKVQKTEKFVAKFLAITFMIFAAVK